MAGFPDERGSVLAEYALVLALLSIAFVIGLKAIETAAYAAAINTQNELTSYGLRSGS